MSIHPSLLRLFHSSKKFLSTPLSYQRYALLACSSPFNSVHNQFPQNSPTCSHSHSSTRVSCSLRAPQQRHASGVSHSAEEREPVEPIDPIEVDHRPVADDDIRYFRSLLGDRCVTDPVELEGHNLDWQGHYKGITLLVTRILHSVIFINQNSSLLLFSQTLRILASPS